MSLATRSLLRASLPVAAGYLSLGFTFGLMFSELGGTTLEAFVISVLCFAGAAQFLALTSYSAGFNPWTLLLSLVILNFRHIFYTLNLWPAIKELRSRFYLVAALTDENFASWNLHRKMLSKAQYPVMFGLNHFYWIAGCTLGSLVPSQLLAGLKGIDFALTALFLVLLLGQLRTLSGAKS